MILIALLSSTVWAYDEQVHYTITGESLKSQGFEKPSALSDGDLAVVRNLIDARARSNPDPAIQAEWLRRYPSAGDFDAWAFKELMLLAPGSTVVGFDVLNTPGPSQLDSLRWASRQPDDDFRNRERLAYDAHRKPLTDKNGAAVPADPALLNMGKLGTLSSQAHAHYGLADLQFSEDPEVLKTDPKRFAMAIGYAPGPILTLASEMNQEHVDLGLIAALSGAPDADSLQWQYTGNGLHYLEDVGNQIHTVQVGLYDFFKDAFFDQLWMKIKTGGGYCGEVRSLGSIGVDILSNHHTISETLTRKRLMEAVNGQNSPVGQRLLAALQSDDPEFAKVLDTALAGEHPEQGGFGALITKALITASSEEGDDVYRATRAISRPKWRAEGVLYDYANTDPDTAVFPPSKKNQADYDAFWALQERAFRRVGTAVRREIALQRAFVSGTTPEQVEQQRNLVIDRLLARQLQMLGAAEQRRANYLANPG